MTLAMGAALPAPSTPLASSAPGPVERPTFAADTHPPAPDYADRRAWAVLPGAPGPSALTPPNATPKAGPETSVDVFYVHPTTYGGMDHWNQDVADAATNAWTDDSVIARQASIFNACCRIFAPRYRQAATGALTSSDGSGDQAYDLAYQDVRRAFRQYIGHNNHGRPFILAGHSQGTLLIYRLIEDEIDKTPLSRRMVAAYAVGVGVSRGEFGRTYTTIKPCATPTQTGCLVSWNTFTRDGDAIAYLQRSEGRFARRYPGAPGRELLCVNPLTFDAQQPVAAAGENLGSLPGKAQRGVTPARLPALIANATGARCDGGLLRVDAPQSPAFPLIVLPGGSLHMHDLDLFYENVRRNVMTRVRAYLTAAR